MKSIKLIIFTVFVVVLSGCANKPFTYQHGHTDKDFTALKTYRWAPDHVQRPFPEISQGLVATANEELQKKGFVLVKEGEVDFIMSFDITATSKVDVNTLKTYGGTGLGFTWRRNQGFNKDPLTSTGSVSQAALLTKGAVILDAIDPVTKEVFWRGVANKEAELNTRSDSIEPMIDVAKATASVSRATKTMLTLFPPEPTAN